MLRSRVELVLILVLLFGLASVPPALAQTKTDATVSGQPTAAGHYDELRRGFIAAAGNELELVKAEPLTASVALGGTTYWLAFVRPTQVGHFAVKYTFKHHDKFYAEGEREFLLRAGGPGCQHYPQPFIGCANVCLGDTVILPIRLTNFSGHRFSVKFTPEPANATPNQLSKFGLNEPQASAGDVNNPLADKIKYLGTVRSERLHRNGGSTVVYRAVFQAVGTGQFNLEVLRDPGAVTTPTPDNGGGIAIIIQKPGTPTTFLAPQEKTIDYTEGRTFSGHASNSYLTSRRVLQIGEIFSVDYGVETHRLDPVRSGPERGSKSEVKPLITSRLFKPSQEYYDAWIYPYLPD